MVGVGVGKVPVCAQSQAPQPSIWGLHMWRGEGRLCWVPGHAFLLPHAIGDLPLNPRCSPFLPGQQSMPQVSQETSDEPGHQVNHFHL